MSDYSAKQRKVVGIFRQTLLLFWKNSILFRRNISGTIAEILVAFLFVIILLFLRYFIDTPHYNDQINTSFSNPVLNVIEFINRTSGRPNIMYYPDNKFVKQIVERAYELINESVGNFSANSKTFNTG